MVSVGCVLLWGENYQLVSYVNSALSHPNYRVMFMMCVVLRYSQTILICAWGRGGKVGMVQPRLWGTSPLHMDFCQHWFLVPRHPSVSLGWCDH